MLVRREIRSLGNEDRKSFIEALLALKKAGRYDQYVHWHHAVMVPTIDPTEPATPDYRNGAHRGPAFLPWHREFLLQVEADLQKINSAITVPYWDWTVDAKLDDPHASQIWSPEYLGGNGVEADSWRVGTGPFANSTGNWPIPINHGGPALLRRFGFDIPTLPTAEDVALAIAETVYDAPPHNSGPFTLGFRNRIEGWVTQRGDARVKLAGSQLHNRVHLWVGGSMTPMTSPNDPVFFLHHCFIDKLWADWQKKQDSDWEDNGYPGKAPRYNPVSGAPQGHNAGDVLKPWERTINEVLDIEALGYSYEKTANQQHILALAASIAPRSTFAAERSPFWAP